MALDINALRKLLEEAGVRPALVVKIDPAQPLLKQGVDSVDFPAFVSLVEERSGLPLDEETSLTLRTLNDFAAWLKG